MGGWVELRDRSRTTPTSSSYTDPSGLPLGRTQLVRTRPPPKSLLLRTLDRDACLPDSSHSNVRRRPPATPCSGAGFLIPERNGASLVYEWWDPEMAKSHGLLDIEARSHAILPFSCRLIRPSRPSRVTHGGLDTNFVCTISCSKSVPDQRLGTCVECRPRFAHIGPTLVEFAQTWPTPDLFWPTCSRNRIGRSLAEDHPLCARRCVSASVSSRLRLNLARYLPKSARGVSFFAKMQIWRACRQERVTRGGAPIFIQGRLFSSVVRVWAEAMSQRQPGSPGRLPHSSQQVKCFQSARISKQNRAAVMLSCNRGRLRSLAALFLGSAASCSKLPHGAPKRGRVRDPQESGDGSRRLR